MKRKKILSVSIILAAALIIVLNLPVIPVVSMSNRKKPSQRYYVDARSQQGFVISYTHSVNKGRVYDEYLCWSETGGIDSQSFLLNSTTFVSYGAGIPEPEEVPGAVFSVTDQGYVISNLNRVVPKLVMAVGIIADHEIDFYVFEKGVNLVKRNFALKDLFEPQTSIIIEKKKVSLVQYLIYKL